VDIFSTTFLLAALIVVFAVAFDFVNGFHDASNVVATMISTRAFAPETALFIAAIANFVGPFVFGTAVAKTIGKGIVDPSAVTAAVILTALLGAIAWNLITWYFGLPSSSSHALVGGLAGAVLAAFGPGPLNLHGILSIVVVLVASPIVGGLAGFILLKILMRLSLGFTPALNEAYKKMQVVSAVALSLSHGTNDAQKSMGIITMTFVSMGLLQTFHVPFWVIFVCALAMGLGTAMGGWKIIKTVGSGIYKLRPIHGFAAQTASAVVILGAAMMGGPVSTTHVVSSTIAGVGSAERIKAVRWSTTGDIVMAWFITIPASALMSAVSYWIYAIVAKLIKGG
jgi:PiT family inorganic phosphate transporter